ncbi:unnamed protein product, partial [Cyprideis torosa]
DTDEVEMLIKETEKQLIQAVVPPWNHIKIRVPWVGGGIDCENPSHDNYIQQFQLEVADAIRRSIPDDYVEKLKRTPPGKKQFQQDFTQEEHFHRI